MGKELVTEETVAYMRSLRRWFHERPELGMQEVQTGKKIREELEELGISCRRTAGYGVIGEIGNQGQGRTVILRADMDALRIQEKTGAAYTSCHEGMMHACGHDGHMAALLGAARELKKMEESLPVQVWLLFQPSEENSLGAKAVCEAGELKGASSIFGLHIFTDIPCGKVSIEPGERMAISDKFAVRICGKGGHAGKPHMCVDATVAAAAVVMNLQTAVSRDTDPVSTVVVTVGHLASGTAHNIISGEALLEGTVRSFSEEDSKRAENAVRRIVGATAEAFGAAALVQYESGLHPAVVNDARETERALRGALQYLPKESFISVPKILLGEDFSVYQTILPGVFAFVGGGNEKAGYTFFNHHEKFDFDEDALRIAANLHIAYVLES